MYDEEFLYKAWQFSLQQVNLDLSRVNPALPTTSCYVPTHKAVVLDGAVIQAAEHATDRTQPRKLYIFDANTEEVISIFKPEGVPETGIILPFLYDQADARWKNYTLYGKKTIGNWGCLLVVYNMMANYWGLTDVQPNHFADLAYERGAMYNQYVVSMGLTRMFTKVESHGWMLRGNILEARIKEWIDKGIPVPARVDFKPATAAFEQHWVLITDYTDDNSWMAADPNGGDLIKVTERYGISGRDVLEGLFFTLRD